MKEICKGCKYENNKDIDIDDDDYTLPNCFIQDVKSLSEVDETCEITKGIMRFSSFLSKLGEKYGE